MANIIKRAIRIFNGKEWDRYHPETSADQVVYTKPDGTASNVQTELAAQNSALNKITAVYSGDYYFAGDITFKKMNGMVCVNADITSKTSIDVGETNTIGYVPDGFYPTLHIYAPLIVYSFVRGVIFITPDGKINLIASEQIDVDSYMRFSLSYAI